MNYTKQPVQISVVIANYNGVSILDDCIESILSQKIRVPIEIIIHDDASTDGSVNYIRDRFPQVHLIESAENVGFCISNNRMAAEAQGKYLLLLNNDARLMPDALQTLLNYADAIVKPAILTLPQYNDETGCLIDSGSFLDTFLNAVPNQNTTLSEVGMAIGACLWIPKTLWEELDGFPEWFGSIGEDLYLCSLARLWGFQIYATGTSGFRHIIGHSLGGGKVTSGRLSTTKQRRANSERNKCFVMLLTYPLPLLLILFPLHLTLLLLEGIVLSLLKLDPDIWLKIYAPVIPALWQARKNLFALRRKVQQKRKIGLLAWLRVFTLLPYKGKLLFKYGIPEIR